MTKNFSEADVKRLLRQREAQTGWTDLREVTLGATINGNRYIGAGGTRVWVTQDARSPFTVERGDANIPDEFGRRVLIGKAPGRSYDQLFSAVSTGGTDTTGNGRPSGTIAHAAQHALTLRWRQDALNGDAVDPAFIGQHQITDLLVLPDSGFTVRILPGWANVNGTPVYIPEGTFFTLDDSEVPAGAGDAVICRLEIDDTGAFLDSYGSDYAEPVPNEDALAEAPAATAGRNTLAYLWIPAGATGIERNWILPASLAERTGGGGAGVEDFVDLGDVPASYSGQANKFVSVKSDETGLEFVTAAASEVGAKLRRVGTVLHDETLGSAGTFDVSSISQDYDDLEIILEGRSTANSSGGVQNVSVSLNNDTTDANYVFQQLSGSGSTASASQSTQRVLAAVPGADATAGRVGLTIIHIPDYTAAIMKAVQAHMTVHNTTAFAIFRSYAWQNTAAINRVTVAVANATDTFEAGTRLRIIGWVTEAIGGLDTSSANVSSPPTDAELDSAFGTPAAVGDGFAAIVDDNGADSAVWFVASNGTSWWYTSMTKAT